MYEAYVRRYTRGFTIVEIIVVIAVIGLLTAVILVSVDSARGSSRDKSRKVDLKNLQLAVEFYKEVHGQYPSRCAAAEAAGTYARSGPGGQDGVNQVQCDNDWIVGLAPDFIPELPEDPKIEQQFNRGYMYWSDGTSYKIYVRGVEKDFADTFEDDFSYVDADCGRPESFLAEQFVFAVNSKDSLARCLL